MQRNREWMISFVKNSVPSGKCMHIFENEENLDEPLGIFTWPDDFDEIVNTLSEKLVVANFVSSLKSFECLPCCFVYGLTSTGFDCYVHMEAHPEALLDVRYDWVSQKASPKE